MTAALMLGVGLGSFVVGPLREAFTLGELYWISTGYPIAVLVIAFAAGRSSARRAARV
jgi:predicted MFS family arabinose efflux permease